MRCDTAKELFSDYLEAKIERPLALTFEQHLDECPSCATEYKEFKNVWNSLGSLPEIDPPLSFRSQVMARIEREGLAKRKQPFWSFNWGSIFSARIPTKAFAAAFVLLLFVALALQMGPQQSVIRGGGAIEVETLWPTTSNDLNRGNTGLQFSVSPAIAGGQTAYKLRIDVKHSDVSGIRLYLLPSSQTNFNPSAVEGAPTIHIPGIKDFVWTETLGPGTAYLEWLFRNQRFSEVIFLPTSITQSPSGSAMFESKGLTLYSALAQLSQTYGIVVVADADLGSPVITAEYCLMTPTEALAEIVKDVEGTAVSWKKMQDAVYAITRK